MATKIHNGKEYPIIAWGRYLVKFGNRIFMKGKYHPGGVASIRTSYWFEIEYDDQGNVKKPFGEGYTTIDQIKRACGIEFPEWQKKKIASRRRKKKKF